MAITDGDIKKLKTVFVTKDELRKVVREEIHEFSEELDEKLETKFTQQRDDFYNKIDPILKEVTDNREERVIINHRLSKHDNRITKLEVQYTAS